jgi:transposase InsO family protein
MDGTDALLGRFASQCPYEAHLTTAANAMCESFFATLECELLDRHSFKNPAEARSAVFEFIEGWYNLHRRHSRLDYVSPIEYERSYSTDACYRSPTPSTETG